MHKVPPELYGITIKELARICKVSVKTATRWKRGQSVPPETALMILSADLGHLAADWKGWTVRQDCLLSPEGWEISMNAVLSAPLLRAQLHALQSESRRFRGLEEQPVFEEIPVIKSVV